MSVRHIVGMYACIPISWRPYAAPEVLRQAGYDQQVDVWSLGIITFILLCGYPPFYDENDAKLYAIILRGHFEFDQRYWSEISFEARDLIEKMLQVDPVRRITTEQVCCR